MCHNRTNNRKINSLYERCLLIIYNDKQSSFSQLLKNESSVSIHIRSIQSLVIKMFSISRNISPPVINNILKQKDYSRITLAKFMNFQDRW